MGGYFAPDALAAAVAGVLFGLAFGVFAGERNQNETKLEQPTPEIMYHSIDKLTCIV